MHRKSIADMPRRADGAEYEAISEEASMAFLAAILCGTGALLAVWELVEPYLTAWLEGLVG